MVYRGRQIALGREVAIKVLPRALAKDASYVARFIREAQIIAGLNHPNIIQIYDAGQQSGVLYFVMEFVQGPTIGSLLQIDTIMPQHLAAEYAARRVNGEPRRLTPAGFYYSFCPHRDLRRGGPAAALSGS